jgi:two-component system response regulator HydG
MRFNSLMYKLFCVLSSTVLLYAALSVLFVNLYFKKVLKGHYIEMGKVLSATMASNVVDGVLTGDNLPVHSYFESVMENDPEVSYIFIEKEGRVLLHTFEGGFPPGLLDVGHEKERQGYVIVRDDGRTYYDFTAPIFGGRAGALRLGLSGMMIKDTLDRTIESLMYIALGLLAFALVFSVVVSRRVIRPLAMLTSSSLEIAGGNYSKTVPVVGEDEVGTLARSFNAMAGALKAREERLREMNEELIKTRQDKAVVETTRAMLHHLRQPLTYLILAIEMFTEEIEKEGAINYEEASSKLVAVEDAGLRVAEVLRKFENLKEYRSLGSGENAGIIDIE